MGVNRVSFGPFIFRSCLQKFATITAELMEHQGYECFSGEMMSSSDVGVFLDAEKEPAPS